MHETRRRPVHPYGHRRGDAILVYRAMDILMRPLGHRPDLGRWEQRPLWPGVEQRPVTGARVDAYEREAPREAPGEPAPDGPHRRAAAAILRYEIFPPALVTGVLRREPVEVGDTVGICY